jgi:hypothetical protein
LLSPVIVATQDLNPFFSWIQGSGGDGISNQVIFNNGVVVNDFSCETNRAFALAAGPEPPTLSLLAVGLGALAARRRRRS